MIFPAVILEPCCGDRIRRYRIIVVTSLMMAVGLTAGGFLRYNMGGGFTGEKQKFEGNFRVRLTKIAFFARK